MYATKLVLFASFFLCVTHADLEKKVPVTVYYESLCPDSKKFFTTQLYPSLQTNLSKWVNLTLVPYGKSNVTEMGMEWQFSCHHGPFECQGNKIQACALNEIEKTTPKSVDQGFNKITLAFINCLMDKTEKKKDVAGSDEYVFPVEECSKINQVQNSADIDNCSRHTTGSKLLADLGAKTRNFQSYLTSVPTIVFNEKYDAKESQASQSNFVKVLCGYITKDKPEECNGCGLKSTVSLLLIAIAFVNLFL
ncbi:hypothetical protein FQR65_LT14494 [Abscondita terminalis]|nr:hypothetical protein FQR65_LT14494 [Abscondita terminalis]